MTAYLPVRHSHGKRTRFTVLVSCSAEFAVHSMSAPLPADIGVARGAQWAMSPTNFYNI